MPSLSAFEDRAVVTRRVARVTDREGLEAVRSRRERGLHWAVGGLTEDDRGRVLFVYEDDVWKLPGGGVESGEARREAVVREVREETGVAVTVDELLAVTEVTVRNDGHRETFFFGTYRTTPIDTTVGTDPGLAGEAIEDVAWKESIPEHCLDGDLLRRVR